MIYLHHVKKCIFIHSYMYNIIVNRKHIKIYSLMIFLFVLHIGVTLMIADNALFYLSFTNYVDKIK